MKIFLRIFVFIFFVPLFAQASPVHFNCENYLIGAGGIDSYEPIDFASPDVHLVYEDKIENSLNAKATLIVPFEKTKEFILERTFTSQIFYRSKAEVIVGQPEREEIEFNLFTRHLTYRKIDFNMLTYKTKSGSTISNTHLNFYYRCKIFNP